MPTLYIIEQNSILRKSGQRFLLCKQPSGKARGSGVRQGDIILDLPCADVDHVLVFGNVQITTAALRKMLEKGVELALFSFSGKLLGQLTPPLPGNIKLRFLQYSKYSDKKFTLDFNKKIIQAKINNGVQLLKHYSWNHPDVLSIEDINKLESLLKQIEKTEKIDTLRGLEGTSANQYFRLFAKAISPPWKFEKRTKRPPRDPVNAVLSFGYVIVASQIQSLLDGMGLDPYIGFYHRMAYNRPSLALDLLEEFRHPLIDRLALKMFNTGIFNQDDFFEPLRGGIYLNNDGKYKFFEQFEDLMGNLSAGNWQDNKDEIVLGREGYYNIYKKQIRNFIDFLTERNEYNPYTF